MIVIALMALVLAVASRVFVQTMRASRDARHYERDVAAIEHALRTLRADVWSSATIRVPSEDRLELSDAEWTVAREPTGADGSLAVLRRGDQRFEFNARVRFVLLDGVLRMEVDDHAVPLVSAVQVAEAQR